jgi:hypothetical protein
MRITYARGVRVGALTIDPDGVVPVAFWTHRPPRRPTARRVLCARALAADWAGTLGLPYHHGSVAAGMRVELLPTGYGPGGAAVLLTQAGRRTLVVGPTTESLEPRTVDQLVLAAPAAVAPPPDDWLQTLAVSTAPSRAVVPDSGAAQVLVDALTAHNVSWSGPAWLGGARRGGQVRVALSGRGLALDLRPSPPLTWLARYASQVQPEGVSVHGPRAHALAAMLQQAGLPVSVIHGPLQLMLTGSGTAPGHHVSSKDSRA